MDDNLSIEEMTHKDIETIYAMELEIFKDDPWPVEWFEEGVENPDGYYFIIYDNKQPLAYCGMYNVTSKTPPYCKIAKLAVVEEYRRKGIGKMLLQKMLDISASLGLTKAKLEVDTTNTALKLYEKFGFVSEELVKNYYDKSGGDAYIMWRYEK